MSNLLEVKKCKKCGCELQTGSDICEECRKKEEIVREDNDEELGAGCLYGLYEIFGAFWEVVWELIKGVAFVALLIVIGLKSGVINMEQLKNIVSKTQKYNVSEQRVATTESLEEDEYEEDDYEEDDYEEDDYEEMAKKEVITKLYSKNGMGMFGSEIEDQMKFLFSDSHTEAQRFSFLYNNNSEAFVEKHYELFAGSTDKYIDDSLIDYSLNPLYVSKNIEMYGNALISIPDAYAWRVEKEAVPKDAENRTGINNLSVIYAQDKNFNNYMIWYLGDVDIKDRDIFKVVGLPIGLSEGEIISDYGVTNEINMIILAGTHIVVDDDADWFSSWYDDHMNE